MLKVYFVDPGCNAGSKSLFKSILEEFAPGLLDWTDAGPSIAVRLSSLDRAEYESKVVYVVIHGISGGVAAQIKAALKDGTKEFVKLYWATFNNARFVATEL